MRRFTRPLVVGTLAFGLVAAAATGVAFTISNVDAAASTASATSTVITKDCNGEYDVQWTLTGGVVYGMTATRTAPSTGDDNVDFCAGTNYAVYVSTSPVDDGAGGIDDDLTPWTLEWSGTTDGLTGDIDNSGMPPASGSFTLPAGSVVKITIGPEAEQLPPPI